jgi:DNA-binding NarL/FixJ family response regulator
MSGRWSEHDAEWVRPVGIGRRRDDAVRDSLQFLLETAGFSVATYNSAAQFLNEASPGHLACLLVDQHMPDVTGLQLVTRLRGQGVDFPIALITGSPSPDWTGLPVTLGWPAYWKSRGRRCPA